MIARALTLLVRLWQIGPSSVMSPTCRYAPSCSAYAIQALHTHGAVRGMILSVRRIARCHPWGGSGYDPVPPATPDLPFKPEPSFKKAAK